MSLTGCLKKAGDALSTQDRAAVLDLAFRKRGEGLKADAAARAALDEMIAGIRDKLGKDAPAKAKQRPQEPEPPLVTKTGRGLPVPTVESIVKSITKWWKNAPAIIVIDTMLDAPKEVFDKYQRETKAAMKAGERLGEVKGFIMPDGRVFIVADAATDARSVVGTVFHEVLGHHGLRGTFGKRIVQILDSVIDMRPADVANKAIEYGMASQYGANGEKLTANAILRGMTKDDRRAAAEEVLVELAEQYPTLKEAGLIRRLIRAIKAWIMENMPNARQFLAMSDEDLIANFVIPARNWIQKGKASRGGAVAFQRAYHGSPHKFDKFSLDKIGTGEGAQAYGYGLYFASKKEIAEHYREALSNNMSGPPRRFFRGVELQPQSPEYHAATLVTQDGRTLAQVRKEVQGWIDDAATWDERRKNHPSEQSVLDGWRKTLVILNEASSKKDFTSKPYRGQLYTVDIPEDSEMLDWDKPLSEQPEGVRKAIKRRMPDMAPFNGLDMGSNATLLDNRDGQADQTSSQPWILRTQSNNGTSNFGLTQKDVDRMLGSRDVDDLKGQQIYTRLAAQKGSQQAASEYLNSMGIRGIKYLDGNSRTAKDGSHNYVIFDDKDVQITDTAFSRAKTEGMATKDVVGNQSGAPADDSMGGVGREARAAISAPSEREGYGLAPTGGMQERAVRAEKSGSPEPAQKSKAAASGAKRTPITARMEADAIAVANKEIARQSEYDVQQELESIQQNGRGYDVEKLIAESPKYWDAENEELTPEGYAELDRRNEQIARDNIGIRDARSLADLDHVHQFAQADAFESLAEDLGASVHGSRSFSTSRYFEVTRADGKTAGFRFADHLNTSSQHNAPDFNIAPGGNTFKQAIDWLNESPTPDSSGVAFSKKLPATIEVDGQQRPTTNSNGQPIHPTEEGVRNFWRWFADSKVVDAQGRPLVVYHGTRANFNVFGNIGGRFSMSAGYYFASSTQRASVYADGLANAIENWNPKSKFTKEVETGANVMPVYLSIKNPLVITNKDGPFNSPEDAFDLNGGALVKAAKDLGHDGVIYRREKGDGFDEIAAVAFRPEQIKSATGNTGQFSPDNADIRYQRTATNPRNLAVEPTARDKIKAAFATPEKSQLSPKIGALDTPLRVALEKTKALNVWRAAFNLTEMLGGYAAHKIAPNLTEHIKAGVIDRYGLDRAVIDQRRATNSAIMGGARTTMRILDKMGALTRAESAVLYRAATTADAAEVEALTKDLRPDSRDALTEIKRLMRDLGAEQVRLGNLDPDTFKRNEWSYLHRTYQKHETEQANDKAASAARALRIKGDQYKTRGLVDAVTAAQLADWLPAPWQAKLKGDKVSTDMRGEKFIRLEAREKTKPIDGEPTLGRLKDVAYWPANEPIPERFKGYTQDASTWELRDVRDGKAMMWRDFTEAERTRMGEIDDIRYALVRTMQLAVQDVETGKYFEWLANNYGKELEQLPDGAVPMTDEDRLKAKLATFPPDSWVKVPDGKVQGTDVRKYGQLAGKYVPGPVWNDVRNMGDESFFTSPIGKAFDSLQNKWKLSKTAMSPAVHVNNIMSNFVFMNWADVQSTQLLEAVKTVATMGKNDDAKALWESFKTHGGDSGAYAFHELQQGELESLLKSLEAETLRQNNLNGLLNLSAALDLWREGEKRQAIAALGKSKTAQAPKALIDAMIKVYDSEDTIFRLAAFIKAKADGMTDEQAGKFAQDSFLDYSINAPWIQALRKTALPFIAFSYRAIPKLYDTAKNKPWKLMSLFIAMQALNMLGYSGSGGDEDKERKLLAKEKRGNIWGYGPVGVPKMIRMPWNDDHGSPVFLDIRRWIPVGDVADIEQSHGALPMPQWASIGGIPALFAEFFLNTQGFTGKKITLDTDTPKEKAIKTGDWAYKALMPNIPLPSLGSMARALGMDLDPGQLETYAATGILNAGNGVTDPFGRELSLSQALMNAVGVKVGAYPEDAAMQQIKMESDAQKREIMSNINRYGRQLNRNGIDQETFDRRRDSNVEKLRKLSEERQGRM